MKELLLKESIISLISYYADTSNDENIERAMIGLWAEINNLDTYSYEQYGELIDGIRGKLRKERKKKKRWKNKYLNLLTDYNELRDLYDDICKQLSEQKIALLDKTYVIS